ncbi:MAG: hypothetical protein J6F31_00825 [Oscillospiraceae bacterium]|nr:hypothetical protein [Oscillospiraceae bacterium]
MPFIIRDIKAETAFTAEEIFLRALKKVKLGREYLPFCRMNRLSVDARKREDIHFCASVWVDTGDASLERRICSRYGCTPVEDINFHELYRRYERDSIPESRRPVIAGFGPAGMFAALLLARCGYRPIVLERGADADKRKKQAELFKSGGSFDENTNVQFGEGGAGTFSDGKLVTRVKDTRCRYVLESFAEFGAPAEILYKAKPHVGTDNLINIVKNIRAEVIRLGGEVRFETPLTGIGVNIGRVVYAGSGEDIIPTCGIIGAVGHSARDTFTMLHSCGIDMEPKAFAVGARIEHTRQSVRESLYGKYSDDPRLPEGEYNLNFTPRDTGRGVYTFCMCPGGTVIDSRSEEKSIVTNGCSEYARDGRNSNSAVVVSVSPKDFGDGVFDGMAFCERIERAAYTAGKGFAPCCTVGSFINGSGDLKDAAVEPTLLPGVTAADFHSFMPSFVTDAMKRGLSEFSKRMHCFGEKGAVLTAPETRTSSPVRIIRGEDMQSLSVKGFFPCGEGAGYAGGITSAAVDGLRQAEAFMEEEAGLRV